MRQKVRSAVYSLVFLIPVAACLEASIAATPPAIPRVELENSRGLSQTTNLGQSTCAANAPLAPCAAAGAVCLTCTVNGITVLGPTPGDGYQTNNGFFLNCGKPAAGTCNAALFCVVTSTFMQSCPKPNPVIAQP